LVAPGLVRSGPVVREKAPQRYRDVRRDGDTIEVGRTAVRLQGVAAPEWDERGGQAASEAMEELVLRQAVRCDLTGERTYDRCVGICYVGGRDIGEEMIRRGFAKDCPKFSGGRYRDAEREAAAEGATIATTYRLQVVQDRARSLRRSPDA